MLDVQLSRKQFWAMSKSGKLRCPKCGAIVVEDLAIDCHEVKYTCTALFCDWEKIINLREIV